VKRVLLSWSSGKDSALTLEYLRRDPEVELAGLITSFNTDADRVAMHAVRRELVQAQAEAVGLPLLEVELVPPGTNDTYIRAMATALIQAKYDLRVSHLAFGDLFLEDVRAFREKQLQPLQLEPLFPVWGQDTTSFADEIVAAGIEAVVTCIDTSKLDASLAGAAYDSDFLAALPDGADPCGENGEFHTFVHSAPSFNAPLAVTKGECIERDGFAYVDVLPDIE